MISSTLGFWLDVSLRVLVLGLEVFLLKKPTVRHLAGRPTIGCHEGGR